MGSGFSKLPSLPEIVQNEGPSELAWNLSNEALDAMMKAQDSWNTERQSCALKFLQFDQFGKNHIKKWKCSPDGFLQMAFQLAYFRQHGEVPPTYESCSTRNFLHGRTETIRSATPEAASWVQSVVQSSPTEIQRSALREAITAHIDVAKNAQQGQGVDRHLRALSEMAADAGV